jgi:hypothetical protein
MRPPTAIGGSADQLLGELVVDGVRFAVADEDPHQADALLARIARHRDLAAHR